MSAPEHSADTDDGPLPMTMALAEGTEPGGEVIAGQLLGWTGDSGNAASCWRQQTRKLDRRRSPMTGCLS